MHGKTGGRSRIFPGRTPLGATCGTWFLGLTVAVVLWVTQAPHRLARIANWLNPASDPLGAGYPILQAMNAIHQAGPWGQEATASLPILPEAASGFIFTYFIYTLG